MVYNLEGVEELTLSAPVLADIFNQKITTWDDPAIAALNDGVTLPAQDITPVNRSDGSGTTENFTDYLAEAAGQKWPYEADSDFPVQGGEAANGTSGVVAAVAGGPGAIGYADLSRAGDLGVAKILVGDEPVAPTPEGAAALVDAAERVSGRPTGDITVELPRDSEDPATYPITLVAYSIVCTTYEDAAQGELVKAFFSYVASEEGQAGRRRERRLRADHRRAALRRARGRRRRSRPAAERPVPRRPPGRHYRGGRADGVPPLPAPGRRIVSAPTPASGLVPDRPTPKAPAATATGSVARLGDRVFSGLATGSGVLILVVLAGVALFLVAESLPLIGADPADLPGGNGFLRYLGPLVFGTLLAAALALLIATPLSIAIALFISHYSPPRLSRTLGYLVDLLAAVPSVVYGLWGVTVVAPFLQPAYAWLADHVGFLPLFAGPASSTGRTMLTGGIVLAGHDPADHDRHQPRGVPPGARRCTRRPRSRSAPRAGR